VQKVTVIMRHLASLILLASAPAAADNLATEKNAATDDQAMALAVNSPLGWVGGTSVGASLYARIAPQQAVRFNVASYEYGSTSAIAAAAFGAEDEGSYDGRYLDLGAAWMYFPRRVWDGPTLEAGLLRRSGETHVQDEFAEFETVDRDTQYLAARALVGWSWLIQERAIISFAVGASGGYELGTETMKQMSTSTPMSHDVSAWKASPEGYIRLGFTFGK
jgi:hypothetical protein